MNRSRKCEILLTAIADRRAQFWHPGCSTVRQQALFRGRYGGSKTPRLALNQVDCLMLNDDS